MQLALLTVQFYYDVVHINKRKNLSNFAHGCIQYHPSFNQLLQCTLLILFKTDTVEGYGQENIHEEG